jgi:tetrahydromethanopterin S-methyltransferase subunit B
VGFCAPFYPWLGGIWVYDSGAWCEMSHGALVGIMVLALVVLLITAVT